MRHAWSVESRGEVLFIGGCSGVGKSSVAAELHALFSASRVRHCVIEGDNLDLAWPVPWEHGLHLAEDNLASMWGGYRAVGYSRLIYTNTASVRAEVLDSLIAALGGNPVVHAVLLQAETTAVLDRLGRREIGSALQWHAERSRRAAPELQTAAPPWVRRVDTTGRSVTDIATGIADDLGWSPDPDDSPAVPGSGR